MTTVVIMPGGFHPFHAGHMSLYNSARRVFPDAEVYVAATNDTSSRPFPFAVKEKLAKLAGVEPGHFVQVTSPFQAKEITQHFDPSRDQLIFVRSEKDQNSPPKPGGVKKDGSPSYLQPLLSAKKLEPFSKHAYMAYLPTVEFGPGMTSATQIRTAWPTLDERRKTALVMSLYPAAQKNPRLAATVVKLLDAAISTDALAEGWFFKGPEEKALLNSIKQKIIKPFKEYTNNQLINKDEFGYPKSSAFGLLMSLNVDNLIDKFIISFLIQEYGNVKARELYKKYGNDLHVDLEELLMLEIKNIKQQFKGVAENQGWAATFTNEETRAYGGQQGAGMTAGYQRRDNQPVAERKKSAAMPPEYARDPELYKLRQYAKQHYNRYADDPEMAMMKLLQRGLGHSEEKDAEHDAAFKRINNKLTQLQQQVNQAIRTDYIDERSK